MFSAFHLFPFVVALALTTTSVTGFGCTFNLQIDTEPTKEPLIIRPVLTSGGNGNLEIAWPSVNEKGQGVIYVENLKEIMFSCTGPNNLVRGVQSPNGIAKCICGELKFPNGKLANIDNVSCTKKVAVATVKNTHESCAPPPYICKAGILPLQPLNLGTKFSIGFQVKLSNTFEVFLEMTEVCHSIEDMWTYYAHHQLHGVSLEGAVQCSGRKCFSKDPKKDGVYKGINPDKAYSQDQQIETLNSILGPGASDKYIQRDKVYLARGHLAPDADFIYYSGQMSTYYFINVAPQWQPFNNGNWKSIEYAVRRLAVQLKKTLNVWTGTQAIQELNVMYDKFKTKKLYLVPWDRKPSSEQKDRLPVPAYYWKLVQEPTKKRCTVVLGYNDVHAKKCPVPICQPMTVQGWPTLQEPSKGFIYYCSYESFKRRAYYIPKIDCNGMLAFPTA